MESLTLGSKRTRDDEGEKKSYGGVSHGRGPFPASALPCVCPLFSQEELSPGGESKRIKLSGYIPQRLQLKMTELRAVGTTDEGIDLNDARYFCKPTLKERLRQQAMKKQGPENSQSTKSFPDQVLLKMMQKKGVEAREHDFDALPEDFFEKPTRKDMEDYTADLVTAVRKCDIGFLRRHHAAGQSLRVRNQVGESLLHVACRCKSAPIVDFLISEVGLPVHVCDIYGRTPLHDTMWTSEPNFQVADSILGQCPDLLLIKDQRGHTPLCYARKEHWMPWLKHLSRNIEQNLPRKLVSAPPIKEGQALSKCPAS